MDANNSNFLDYVNEPLTEGELAAQKAFFDSFEGAVVIVNTPEQLEDVIDWLYWHSFSVFDQEGIEVYPGGSREACLKVRQPGQYIAGHCIAHGDFDGDKFVSCPQCSRILGHSE